mmetsp:Transcript_5872/g.9248  ORF Transcript_5872/g.9248 Transcript_5872/m.9248 type:complete len:416 (-) Transcript_5872:4182-5429(-)
MNPSSHLINSQSGGNGKRPSLQKLEGVLFHRTIRSVYAVLLVAVEDSTKVVVRIQIQDGSLATELRSWCRRNCKIGDLLVLEGNWAPVYETSENNTEWTEERFLVDVTTELDAEKRIILKEARHWDWGRCQMWQQRYLVSKNNQVKRVRRREGGGVEKSKADRHGGGIGKLKQSEHVANFLIHMTMHRLGAQGLPEPCNWGDVKPHQLSTVFFEAVKALNLGTGVIDAAGGSGYVSMALGLSGVRSTVVDPRESVGKLPGKDRKKWKKAIRSAVVCASDGTPLCQPVVQYETMRAWFANRPNGVDKAHRHPDQDEIKVCNVDHELLAHCSAIVALHPDEATDTIVDVAVQKRIPFMIIPCCVFSRIFPNRRIPNSSQPVCTYDDLIDYLMAKDKTIEKAFLPFEGANVVLWSIFE